MPLLFSYGTLQQEDVQLSTFGRRLNGERDALTGCEPSLVKIADPELAAKLGKTHHAGVTFNGNSASSVPGMVFDVADAELAGVDTYESAFYYMRVLARLASGRDAWVYVHTEFRFAEGLPILQRTPDVLRALLSDLPPAWITATEGPKTWSPFDVLGHLIHGERTDWVPRVEHILRHGDAVPFPPFDREAMFIASKGKTLAELLDTFQRVRSESLARLRELDLTDADLARHGRHPELGSVTMRQLLSTWVAHDLTHISQVVRVMAHQYSEAVGPWRSYLSILGRV